MIAANAPPPKFPTRYIQDWSQQKVFCIHNPMATAGLNAPPENFPKPIAIAKTVPPIANP